MLWTRRRKAREGLLRLGAVLAPIALLVLAVVATGGRATAVAMGIFGGLVALAIVGDIRTPRGALYAGIAIAAALLVLNIAVAWLIDNPILE